MVPPCASLSELANSVARAGKVLQLHLRVFTAQNDALRSTGECGAHRIPDTLATALGRFDRDVNIDARINHATPLDISNGALRLASNVLGRESSLSNFFELSFFQPEQTE